MAIDLVNDFCVILYATINAVFHFCGGGIIFEMSTRLVSDIPLLKESIFRRYLESLALKTDNRQDPLIKVALFGVGRAGTIHLTNIVSNIRAQLLYIVDDVESNWQGIRKYWRLDNVTFLNSKQSDKIFKDPK